MPLLERLGFRRPRQTHDVPDMEQRCVPDGVRLYAVGDIHGRYDLLGALGEFIDDELASHPPKSAATIFLGDYVDRGPQSAQVIDRLARGDWPTAIIPLLGNHEDVLLQFLTNESILEVWRHWGGLETLVSYGVDIQPALTGRDYEAVQRDFAARLPPHHHAFLNGLLPSYTAGDYFFCHAGVRPGVPLERQRREDLIMIREPFLSSTLDHGKIVVHGHTPTQDPVFLYNQIGIDTGAYATGRLSALALEGTSQRLLSAHL